MYDGDGLRVQKGYATGCTDVTWSELYWRDTGGNTIAETDGSGSTTNASYNEYVFFAGKRIAQSNPSSGNVYYYFADHLGSTRVVTNASGAPCYSADFLPYGLENTPSGFTNSCSTNYKFTGYERDSETGNDYAFARYYSQREERFLRPDPLDGDVSDPQTLDKYTYARNNPTNLTDPSGMFSCGEECGGGGGGGGGGCGVDCGRVPACFTWCGGGNYGSESPQTTPASVGTAPNSPSPGESAADDPYGGETSAPWALGCEALGMPCGMQFPGGGGGLDPSGCTYGGGSCGGGVYGFLNGASGSWNNPWWNKIPFLVGLAKTFGWESQARLNTRPVKTSPRPRPVETNKPAPGQDPEGGIDREMEELLQKASDALGAIYGAGSHIPWGDVSVPALLFPGQQPCMIDPWRCHEGETY